jgi:hypothetical protein
MATDLLIRRLYHNQGNHRRCTVCRILRMDDCDSGGTLVPKPARLPTPVEPLSRQPLVCRIASISSLYLPEKSHMCHRSPESEMPAVRGRPVACRRFASICSPSLPRPQSTTRRSITIYDTGVTISGGAARTRGEDTRSRINCLRSAPLGERLKRITCFRLGDPRSQARNACIPVAQLKHSAGS